MRHRSPKFRDQEAGDMLLFEAPGKVEKRTRNGVGSGTQSFEPGGMVDGRAGMSQEVKERKHETETRYENSIS